MPVAIRLIMCGFAAVAFAVCEMMHRWGVLGCFGQALRPCGTLK